MLTFLDLCSGIGGGRLGLENAGMECIGYCDTSRLANITYNLIHSTDGELFFTNIKKIAKGSLPLYDVLIAGFPCQTFSVIGRQNGFNDSRGQIIFTLCDILKFSQPKYFILENVKGLVTHNNGETYKTILKALHESGYRGYSKVLTTFDYGIPQNRQRIYFIGIRNDLFCENLFQWPSCRKSNQIESFFLDDMPISEENLFYFKRYLMNPTNNNKYSLDEILSMENMIIDTRMNDLRLYRGKMPTLRSQRDGIYYVHHHQLYQLTGTEALLFQGFPYEKIKDLKNKVSDRHLLMQAGNAMSVNVIEELGKSIAHYNNQIIKQNGGS